MGARRCAIRSGSFLVGDGDVLLGAAWGDSVLYEPESV